MTKKQINMGTMQIADIKETKDGIKYFEILLGPKWNNYQASQLRNLIYKFERDQFGDNAAQMQDKGMALNRQCDRCGKARAYDTIYMNTNTGETFCTQCETMSDWGI